MVGLRGKYLQVMWAEDIRRKAVDQLEVYGGGQCIKAAGRLAKIPSAAWFIEHKHLMTPDELATSLQRLIEEADLYLDYLRVDPFDGLDLDSSRIPWDGDSRREWDEYEKIMESLEEERK